MNVAVSSMATRRQYSTGNVLKHRAILSEITASFLCSSQLGAHGGARTEGHAVIVRSNVVFAAQTSIQDSLVLRCVALVAWRKP